MYIYIHILYTWFWRYLYISIRLNTIFKVLSTKILTFYLLYVYSISLKIIVENAKAIHGHLWAHKSNALILEIYLLYIYCIRWFLSSITVQCIYGKKKEILYQIWSLTKQTPASPVMMADARWFIIEGRREMCSLWKKLTLPQVSPLLWIFQCPQEKK